MPKLMAMKMTLKTFTGDTLTATTKLTAVNKRLRETQRTKLQAL